MARMVINMDDVAIGTLVGQQWNIGEFPKPPPPDNRETAVATERMLWAHNGALAAPVGRNYFVADLPMLVTQSEWIAQQA